MLVSGNTFPVTESMSTLDVSSFNDALHLGNFLCKSPVEVVSYLVRPVSLCYHQTFQVPKTEGFLNLISGYFGGGFPLT